MKLSGWPRRRHLQPRHELRQAVQVGRDGVYFQMGDIHGSSNNNRRNQRAVCYVMAEKFQNYAVSVSWTLEMMVQAVSGLQRTELFRKFQCLTQAAIINWNRPSAIGRFAAQVIYTAQEEENSIIKDKALFVFTIFRPLQEMQLQM